ncbi:heavy-metal-associated domain-containing protein [Bacillus spongiae]|uniref:Heavy-metal-associated domain-containing protein n=1 Tax=Bacillus spongiae TaxID=2683610 RepID=A0ABU8HDN8_9BACI
METTIKVQGITVENAQNIRQNLQNIHGVKTVHVHLDSSKIEVAFEGNQVTEDQLKTALRNESGIPVW